MTRHELYDYAAWLLRLPTLPDLGTYAALVCANGAGAGALDTLVFARLMSAVPATICAIGCMAALFAIVCHLEWRSWFGSALLVSIGIMSVTAAVWPYFHFQPSKSLGLVLLIVGVIISLPLFCREMEQSRDPLA